LEEGSSDPAVILPPTLQSSHFGRELPAPPLIWKNLCLFLEWLLVVWVLTGLAAFFVIRVNPKIEAWIMERVQGGVHAEKNTARMDKAWKNRECR
jgi:hypothetical protein